MSTTSSAADVPRTSGHAKVVTVRLPLQVWDALAEACVMIGHGAFLAIVKRQRCGELVVIEDEMPVVLDYLAGIDQYLSTRYPDYDDTQPNYNAADDDAFLRDLEIYRHPLAYELTRRLGSDVFVRYLVEDWNVVGNTSIQTGSGSPGLQ